MKTYYKVWKITAFNALQEAFINRWSNLFFIIGKSIRLFMSLLFFFLIRGQVSKFGDYTIDQMLVFYLVYQFIDTLAQVFFRGVYLFSNQVRTGEFDFLLLKPISPLFRALTGKPDINDVIFIIPSTLISFYLIYKLNISISLTSGLWFLALLLNSFLIITAFHILVLVVGILTTEVDGVIWMYRDLTQLGQFPVNVYLKPLREILFFLVPVGMMITIPSQVLLGLTTSYGLSLVFTIGISFFIISYLLWRWSLKRYSSASS